MILRRRMERDISFEDNLLTINAQDNKILPKLYHGMLEKDAIKQGKIIPDELIKLTRENLRRKMQIKEHIDVIKLRRNFDSKWQWEHREIDSADYTEEEIRLQILKEIEGGKNEPNAIKKKT
jgi:hypothetical protein